MIEINNLTKVVIDKKALKRLGKQVLIKEGVQEKVELSIALVEEKEIQKLNKTYRGKDEPTDVLSFEGDQKFIFSPLLRKQIGEIVICPSQVRGGGQKGIEEVLVHGLLHLLGYSHQGKKEAAIMMAKEKRYLSLFRKNNKNIVD